MGDPERYRESAEVEKWSEDDPIGIYRRYLLKKKIATAKVLDAEEEKVEEELQEAVQFAESSADPPPEALYEDIFVEGA
jgi:TPP-dependent pyruvate/acetoin dehydrogenase alpha subunit